MSDKIIANEQEQDEMALATKEYKELILRLRFGERKTYDAIASELPVSRATVVRIVKAEVQRRQASLTKEEAK